VIIRAKRVVRGRAQGTALVCPGGLSFLGDIDLATGEIIAAGHPCRGEKLAGRILIYEEARGSSGGCVVLLSLAKAGLAPAAIVTVRPADYNMAEGAILAGIPFVCQPEADVLSLIRSGQHIDIDANHATLTLNMTLVLYE
jgi:uncharacterized protein